MNIGLLLKKYELHALMVGPEQCAQRVAKDYPRLKPYEEDMVTYFTRINVARNFAIDLSNHIAHDSGDTSKLATPLKL